MNRNEILFKIIDAYKQVNKIEMRWASPFAYYRLFFINGVKKTRSEMIYEITAFASENFPTYKTANMGIRLVKQLEHEYSPRLY